MRLFGQIVAMIGAFMLLLGAEPMQDSTLVSALSSACDRNASLNAYTFNLDATIRMRSFPWLRFHIGGNGKYVRGKDYLVNLTHAPFFAKDFRQIDLSPLDPSMWQQRYVVAVAEQNDGATTFALRTRKRDPKVTNPLVEALVTLDASQSTRDVILRYAQGQIELRLTPAPTQGYLLPATSDVTISMPGESFTARAYFTNYQVSS